MFRALLQLTNFGLLTVLFLATTPTHADTILVGTGLVSPASGPELCPEASDCTNRFSQFSTPQSFLVNDVKVDISGPIPAFAETNGDFQVSIITNPGISQIVIANVGSGSLPLNMGFKDQVFDFSGLSILLNPGVEYYLEVTGGNLMWDRDTPLLGTFGTLGLQLSCDPFQTCGTLSRFDTVPFTYAEQISGDPVPEPSTWLFLSTGLFLLYQLSKRRVAHT